MRLLDEFPHAIRTEEHFEVPVRDGIHLAARMWLPESASSEPVPAVLEFIPYRKRDGTRQRDELHHPYLAGHGYACLRVDLRGSGDSEGVLTDEYLEVELCDAEDVLAWIAEQPWCDGNVGMMGISWGGFNALQVAARRPRALGAVISVASTDDRYADDVHYMGGCLLGDNLSWASTMFAYNSLPPDPLLVPNWRERWHERLEGSGLWLETWLAHQHRDDYWKHGSVAQDPRAIDVPVMAVSGWADGYSNTVFRLLRDLQVPRMGLVGPWSHKYPHMGSPGPAIGWLQECVRWFDRWLKKIDNGIEEEPMLRAWMQESVPPFTTYDRRPGRWVTEPSWPSPNTEFHTLQFAPGQLRPTGSANASAEDEELLLHSPLSQGLFAGKWASYASGPDLPDDQQEEDGGALTFETPPLEHDCEVLGAAILEVELASDVPVAMLAVRLSDVRPTQEATRVSYGLLNLTHRDGHDQPRPLMPGERIRVRIQLNDAAQRFPAGNRIRLALSTSYWPMAWPSPEPVHLTIFPAASSLTLPLRIATEQTPIQFDEPEAAHAGPVSTMEPGSSSWQVLRDLGTSESVLEVVDDRGTSHLEDIDLLVRRRATERYSITGADVTSARGETVWEMGRERGDWRVDTVTKTALSCDATSFHVHATLDAFEGGERVHSSNWSTSVDRRLV